MANQDLSCILTDLRKANKLSQQQVADLIGINRSTYAYYETGKSKPKLTALKKLATVYGKSIDQLLGSPETPRVVAVSPSKYANDWGAETSVSSLSDFEQAVLLKLRLMNFEEKKKLIDFIEKNIEKARN